MHHFLRLVFLLFGFVAGTSATAADPKIVTLSNGNFLVAYSSRTGGAGFHIRGQVFDGSGDRIGGEIPFTFPNEIDEREFDIAALPGGHLVIVTETKPSTGHVMARTYRIDDSGQSRFIGRQLAEYVNSSGRYINPVVTGLDEDSYRVLWVDEQDSGRIDVRFDGMDGGQEVHGGPQRSKFVDRFTGGDKATLDTDTLSNGNVVVVVDPDGKGRSGELHYRVVRPDGSTVKSGKTGNRDEQTFHSRLAALADGGFVIAWTRGGRDVDLEFQMFDANGDATTGRKLAGLTNGRSPDNNNEPAIAPLDDGGFIIFYDKDRGRHQVRGQRYRSDGNKAGDDFIVADGNGAQIDATALPNGRVAVTYKMAGTGTIKTALFAVDQNVVRDGPGNDVLIGGADSDTLPGQRSP